ncbi:protein phosphatase 2C containing protein [Aphelenchoides avenae]|nr:protein phosphatase 2C containing protein [Aphelenchus avenae]
MSEAAPLKRKSESSGFALYDDDDLAAPPPAKQVLVVPQATLHAAGTASPKADASLIAVAVGRKGEREEQEDRHVVRETFPVGVDIKRSAFFALFDGHGGKQASEYCTKHFPDRLAEACAKYATPSRDLEALQKSIKKLFTETYKTVDDEFLKEAKKVRPPLKDGTTATTVLLLNDVLYCANIGDSKAVVCRNKEDGSCVAMQISVDHSPINYDERVRIQKAGGTVKDGRVLGILEVSRSIGDGQFKAHGVISTPDVKKLTLTSNDKFLLLACDGLWKVFSGEAAINFILNKSKAMDNEAFADGTEKWTKVADELTAEAVRRGCGDNVSVVLVVFV